MPFNEPHDLEPDTDVLVSPRYLAGPGTGDAITRTLDSAAGWKVVAFGADTYYTSPCQRVRIANTVDSRYGGWTIAYAEDPLGPSDWITTFDRNTPQEIVAAFTDTLVDGLPHHFADHLSGGKHHTGPSPAHVFASHQWEPVRAAGPFRTVSPDGHAAFRIRGGWLHEYDELLDPKNSTWHMSAGADPLSAPSWQAYFSRYTPEHLITAAATTLIAPQPVIRAAHHVPDGHRSLVKIRPVQHSDAVPRAKAARARSPRTEAVPAVQLPSSAAAPLPRAGSRRQR
ncbi:DUF317 domain-containing protein [Streptomyces nigrescens]|uniref:DUF317 domain-containing protein n=1 Tax=Streptomyces nigrescens TaxID=1920 RepID=A0A640TR98_STRNI|nr:DUF317 domain-containing protein [Streptomyces libani]WAU00074.1 DUF317 domain-containing protein [Streptomyces libani subsp. libani]GFE25710.1 hypothetical protein Sliba_61630 [Streptomyces libani subsp. libani]GGV98817.1 hypothetical protein GCM10010500_48380 [Streptomyces libani subsp. libani]